MHAYFTLSFPIFDKARDVNQALHRQPHSHLLHFYTENMDGFQYCHPKFSTFNPFFSSMRTFRSSIKTLLVRLGGGGAVHILDTNNQAKRHVSKNRPLKDHRHVFRTCLLTPISCIGEGKKV